ncbi:hypothetical protein FIBSPDRAFT_950643 [Athelia psychrophila]|uniref:Uncharacterized protein n=1 Tax=Athelia psychrophila TaxID=1759441 RepID=A0A166NER8_9AGAM|nr:hypothetical protein FIBSPDRAFT_950643 [Fibularhizoctonia sp. CBS 109695]
MYEPPAITIQSLIRAKKVAISPQRLLRVVSGSVSRSISSNWRNAFLLSTKFFCHWLLAQSFQVTGVFSQTFQVSGALAGSNFLAIEILARYAQLWYLSAALVVFATITSSIAIYKPRGPLPAAYGHFQTLADLIIDEWPIPDNNLLGKSNLSHQWPTVLYRGHKLNNGGVCHAGTTRIRVFF